MISPERSPHSTRSPDRTGVGPSETARSWAFASVGDVNHSAATTHAIRIIGPGSSGRDADRAAHVQPLLYSLAVAERETALLRPRSFTWSHARHSPPANRASYYVKRHGPERARFFARCQGTLRRKTAHREEISPCRASSRSKRPETSGSWPTSMRARRRRPSASCTTPAGPTRWARCMKAPRPWTGWSRSRSAGSRSRPLPPRVSGLITASTSSTPPATWTSRSRSSARCACSMVLSRCSTL